MSDDRDSIFNINRSALKGVSEMDSKYYDLLVAESAIFRVIEVNEETVGYVCALTREAAYYGEEFLWFQKHITGNFLYIDQVAISKPFRYKGLGKRLYSDLEELSRQINITTLVCEVNYEPFNVESQAFHHQLGFIEIDRISTRGIVVSLLVKKLNSNGKSKF
ncbi:MAG: GNAT family N-acetyltransferase [Deltaproteobacteria bacterium]